MAVIYILLALLAVFLFWKKYYVAFLFIYLGVITGFFMLDPVTNSGFCGDVCIIMNILLLIIQCRCYQNIAAEYD